MSVNIWHKAKQKPKGDSWEIVYINKYNKIREYSAEDLYEECMYYDEWNWEKAVICFKMLRWAYKESFIESTFNYCRIEK